MAQALVSIDKEDDNMANKKTHWYILVLTDEGPKFLTSIGDHHTAYWDKNEPPKELSKAMAEDITLGLLMNFHTAYAIPSPIELEQQPYHYNKGHFEWVWDEKEDKE